MNKKIVVSLEGVLSYFRMSSLDQIGVQRTRRGGRRGQQNQGNVQMQSFPQSNQPIQMSMGTFPQHFPPQEQQFPNVNQPIQSNTFQVPQQMPSSGFIISQPQPTIQQYPSGFTYAPSTQQLLDILAQAEKKNMEMKQELALHKQKIELLEKQMTVFYGKISRYEQSRLESKK